VTPKSRTTGNPRMTKRPRMTRSPTTTNRLTTSRANRKGVGKAVGQMRSLVNHSIIVPPLQAGSLLMAGVNRPIIAGRVQAVGEAWATTESSGKLPI
jgi:hypothetical protein